MKDINKTNYYSIIRMQASQLRGEIINIGVLLWDKEKKKHTIQVLPLTHEKIKSVALKGFLPSDYTDILQLFIQSIENLDKDGVSPFDDSFVHADLSSLQFLAEQHLVELATPSAIRNGADLEMVFDKTWQFYVD